VHTLRRLRLPFSLIVEWLRRFGVVKSPASDCLTRVCHMSDAQKTADFCGLARQPFVGRDRVSHFSTSASPTIHRKCLASTKSSPFSLQEGWYAKSLQRCTISLSPLQRAKLDEVAALEKRNYSAVIRAAFDWIIQQDHPEVRERLIAEADRRMAIHHGAR